MEVSDSEPKHRMSLARGLPQNNDARAKFLAVTEVAVLVAQFIEEISPIMIELAIGHSNAIIPPLLEAVPRCDSDNNLYA